MGKNMTEEEIAEKVKTEVAELVQLISAALYFEEAITESDEIIAACSDELRADLTAQREHFAVALTALEACIKSKARTTLTLTKRGEEAGGHAE